MKSKLGRPKKPKAERRSNVLRVLLTDGERASLNDVAGRKGMDVSTWARMVLLDASRAAAT